MMTVLHFVHWRTMLSDCDSIEEVNNILDLMIENSEVLSNIERYELALHAINQLKRIAGVK